MAAVQVLIVSNGGGEQTIRAQETRRHEKQAAATT